MALDMTATPETVWAALQETDRLIKESKVEHDRMLAETDKKFKEVAAQQKETDKKIQEVAAQQKKTDAQIAKVSKEIGGLGNSLGDMTEGLLTTDLLERFQEMNLDFDDALHNGLYPIR
jgi:peptidoglycan hydrolase CwlO-like protein